MELKQLEYSKRIEFLIRFTAEIINTKLKEEIVKQNIEVEKLKQKLLPKISEEIKIEEKKPEEKIEKISKENEKKNSENKNLISPAKIEHNINIEKAIE